MEILANGTQLWAGELTVGDAHPSSFSQSFRTAAVRCFEDGEWRDAIYTQQGDIRLSLSLPRVGRYNEDGANPDRVTLDVRWQRPLSDCDAGGQASVGFNRSISLKPGATETVAGDTGLTVRLTRVPPDK